MARKKFDLRRAEIEEEFKRKLDALEEQEKKEREKRIKPIVEKFAQVAEQEARKFLEENDDVLEDFSFRKREVSAAMAEMIDAFFGQGDDEEDASGESGDDTSSVVTTEEAANAPAPQPDAAGDADNQAGIMHGLGSRLMGRGEA